jgi:ubiquinone biosynthesis protein UbiJ
VSAPASFLDQLAGQAAVTLLNRLLARETWAREKLAPFVGRVARLELPPFAVLFAVAQGGTLVTTSAPPNVTLTADTAALPALLSDPKALLRNVRLQGDAEFAQALGAVLQNLKPEPEEELAPFIGDAAAVRLVGFARAAFAQALDAGKRLSETAADYFVAENPLLAPKEEVEAFVREVNELRDATERLASRVERLEKR